MPNCKPYGGAPRWPRGWMLACLMLCLSACAQNQATPAVVHRVERQYPPTSLLLTNQEPSLKGNLNQDLVQWSLDLRDSLRSCNADKSALATWALEGQAEERK